MPLLSAMQRTPQEHVESSAPEEHLESWREDKNMSSALVPKTTAQTIAMTSDVDILDQRFGEAAHEDTIHEAMIQYSKPPHLSKMIAKRKTTSTTSLNMGGAGAQEHGAPKSRHQGERQGLSLGEARIPPELDELVSKNMDTKKQAPRRMPRFWARREYLHGAQEHGAPKKPETHLELYPGMSGITACSRRTSGVLA